MKFRAFLFAALAAVSAFGQTYKSVTLDQDGLLVAPTNLWSANAAGISAGINETVAPLLENVAGLQDALDGKLSNDGGAVYVDSGTVIANDFAVGGNAFNSLWDGDTSHVALSDHANTASYDETGSNQLSTLFDGSGGNTLQAQNCDNIWNGEGYIGTAGFFDGSIGFTFNSVYASTANNDFIGFFYEQGYGVNGTSGVFLQTNGDASELTNVLASQLSNGVSTFGYDGNWQPSADDKIASYGGANFFDASGFVGNADLLEFHAGDSMYQGIELAYKADQLNALTSGFSDPFPDLSQLYTGDAGWVVAAGTANVLSDDLFAQNYTFGYFSEGAWGPTNADRAIASHSLSAWFDDSGFHGDGSALTGVSSSNINDGSPYSFQGDGMGAYYVDSGGVLLASELQAGAGAPGFGTSSFYFNSVSWVTSDDIEANVFHGDGGALAIGEGVTISQLVDGTGGWVASADYADPAHTQVLSNLFTGNDGHVVLANKAQTLITISTGFTSSQTIAAGAYSLITMAGTTAGQSITLPAPSADLTIKHIKNRSNQTWTIASASGSQIYTTSAQASVTLAAGAGLIIASDGTYWNVIP